MNESVGSEGGFLVHPEFLPEITQSVFENDPILSRVKQIPISAGKQSVTYNVIDETSARRARAPVASRCTGRPRRTP
jgi:HK97 family phage major capsid protein